MRRVSLGVLICLQQRGEVSRERGGRCSATSLVDADGNCARQSDQQQRHGQQQQRGTHGGRND